MQVKQAFAGNDPRQPGVTRDNEECAEELIDAEGELLEISEKCLERI